MLGFIFNLTLFREIWTHVLILLIFYLLILITVRCSLMIFFSLPLSHTYSVCMCTCMYVKYFTLCTCVPVRMTTTGMQVSIETIRGDNIHTYILYSVHLSMWRCTMFICVFVEVRGQYWISSSINVHLSFCRLSHWPCQFSQNSWLRKSRSLILLTSSPQ